MLRSLRNSRNQKGRPGCLRSEQIHPTQTVQVCIWARPLFSSSEDPFRKEEEEQEEEEEGEEEKEEEEGFAFGFAQKKTTNFFLGGKGRGGGGGNL